VREFIDRDKSNRYAVSLQNRLFKSFQGLALMDKQEQSSLRLNLPNVQKDSAE